jgi:FkbM family methyltransferase
MTLAARFRSAQSVVAIGAAKVLRKQVVKVRWPGISQPILLRVGSADIPAYEDVVINRQYECDLPFAPDVIIDAGAHIGLASVFFANRYPHAQIIAIEPETANFRLLEKNIHPYKNVRAIKAALWSRDGDVILKDPGIGTWGFQVAGDGPGAKVPALTVPTLLARENIRKVDLLKVDIEGAEKEVFAGNLEWLGRVKFLMIETHHWLVGCRETVTSAMIGFQSWTKGEVTFYQNKQDI